MATQKPMKPFGLLKWSCDWKQESAVLELKAGRLSGRVWKEPPNARAYLFYVFSVLMLFGIAAIFRQ